jgi:transcriptional regulator with XRE-family HTH domain
VTTPLHAVESRCYANSPALTDAGPVPTGGFLLIGQEMSRYLPPASPPHDGLPNANAYPLVAPETYDLVFGDVVVEVKLADFNTTRTCSAGELLGSLTPFTYLDVFADVVAMNMAPLQINHHDAPASGGSDRRKRAISQVVDAASRLRRLLEGWSDQEVADLFGVTRQAWRSWANGSAFPRSARRKRLYRIERILDLRARTHPDEALTVWMERPFVRGLSPADLLRQGQDDFVAALAVQSASMTGDDILLDAPLDLGEAFSSEFASETYRIIREQEHD